MQKYLLLFSLFFLLFNTFLLPQNKSNFGVNAGLAIPVGEGLQNAGLSFQGGAVARIDLNSPFMLAIGANYIYLTGEDHYDSEGVLNIFAGTHTFLGKDGIYYVVAGTANFADNWSRAGLSFGGGYQMPLEGSKSRIDFGVNLHFLNFFGTVFDEEENYMVLSLTAGITF